MDADLKLKAEQLAGDLASPAATLDDLNGLFRSLMKSALERLLDTAMDVRLGRKSLPSPAATDAPTPDPPALKDRRNGPPPEAVRGARGEVTLDTPRGRNGTSAPQLIGKHRRRPPGFDEKVLALCAKGLTARDIQDVVEELYGVEAPPRLVSEITADLDAEVTAWRRRRPDPVWPIVYLDGIVVRVRGESGRASRHTMYGAVGVNLRGKKELFGLWPSETEGAKFRLSCLTDLKNRGLSDIFVVRVDGLTGFPEAIRTACPRTKVQPRVVRPVRTALRYVADKDSRAVAQDLKKVSRPATVLEAEQGLARFAGVGGEKEPTIVKQWRSRWSDIVALFEFPPPIRKAIAATNALESLNGVIRKFTRNRRQYPNAESALKRVYLAIHEASKRRTMPITGRKAALNPFAVVFEDRVPQRGAD